MLALIAAYIIFIITTIALFLYILVHANKKIRPIIAALFFLFLALIIANLITGSLLAYWLALIPITVTLAFWIKQAKSKIARVFFTILIIVPLAFYTCGGNTYLYKELHPITGRLENRYDLIKYCKFEDCNYYIVMGDNETNYFSAFAKAENVHIGATTRESKSYVDVQTNTWGNGMSEDIYIIYLSVN